jgi:hypothetical protein
LAAQNQGRYDDYAALYAPGFAGVKRVGKTVKAMNRAAWLKDRKAMFKAKLEVSARDVVIAPPAAAGRRPASRSRSRRPGARGATATSAPSGSSSTRPTAASSARSS